MCLELDHFFTSIEVEAPQHKVVTATDEPILSRDELACSDGNICDFKGLYDCRGLVIV